MTTSQNAEQMRFCQLRLDYFDDHALAIIQYQQGFLNIFTQQPLYTWLKT